MREFGCSASWSAATGPIELTVDQSIIAVADARTFCAFGSTLENVPEVSSPQGAQGTCSDATVMLSDTDPVGGPPGLLLAGSGRIDLRPLAEYKFLSSDRMAVYMAFIDAGRSRRPVRAGVRPARIEAVIPRAVCNTNEAMRHWLTMSSISGSGDAGLLDHLRIREAYLLATYLLASREHACGEVLYKLCEDYGLSVSYFRKLCKRIFGQGAKSTLSEWRAVNAVLDIVTGNLNILNIAMVNGYSSASHISREIHSKFGHTPSEFKHGDGLFSNLVKRANL